MSSGILMTGLVPKGVIFHAPTTDAAFGAARAGCSFAVSTMSDLRASAFPVKIRGPKACGLVAAVVLSESGTAVVTFRFPDGSLFCLSIYLSG